MDSKTATSTGSKQGIAEHHEDRWTKLVSNWNPAMSTKHKGYWKQVRPAERWEDDLNIDSQPDGTNRDINEFTSDTTWLTMAENSSKWDAVESDFASSRLKQPARPTTPTTTTTTTQRTTHDHTADTAKTHNQNEDDTRDDDEQGEDDTLLVLSQLIGS